MGAQAMAAADVAQPVAIVEQTKWFPEVPNAYAVIQNAVRDANQSGRFAVIVFGADWCHDSRALARALTSPEFVKRFGPSFAVTFIDVGKPQTGKGHNLDVVSDLGVKDLKSTPAMFVISGGGTLLNGTNDALSWRNADSRRPVTIFCWFDRFLKKHNPSARD